MTLLAPTDPALAAAVGAAGRVLLDVGCGDGRHTVRWAQRRPDALVIGLDAETTRLDKTLIAVRKKKLGVLFVGAAVERPPAALLGRADELAVVMPWGSLLDGVLGGDPEVLRAVLALGGPGATLDAVVNVRPWDAPDSVDRKLAATPEPTADHLAALVRGYAELGWALRVDGRLTDDEARALGSTWASRVVAARASRLLRLRATAPTPPGGPGTASAPGPGGAAAAGVGGATAPEPGTESASVSGTTTASGPGTESASGPGTESASVSGPEAGAGSGGAAAGVGGA